MPVMCRAARRKARRAGVALHVLQNIVRILHPAAPFVSEELWQHLRPLLIDAVPPRKSLVPHITLDSTASRTPTPRP
mgnify:CR=1 FL=1